MRSSVKYFIFTLALLSCGVAQAQQAPGPLSGRPPSQSNGEHEPPPPAFDNCAGKTEGAALMIKLRDGQTAQATCERYVDGRLFSKPNRPPRPEGGAMAARGPAPAK